VHRVGQPLPELGHLLPRAQRLGKAPRAGGSRRLRERRTFAAEGEDSRWLEARGRDGTALTRAPASARPSRSGRNRPAVQVRWWSIARPGGERRPWSSNGGGGGGQADLDLPAPPTCWSRVSSARIPGPRPSDRPPDETKGKTVTLRNLPGGRRRPLRQAFCGIY
jgi:hypothetical protein